MGKKLGFPVVLLVAGFLFSGCISKPPSATSEIITFSAADLTIVLKPLNRDQLIELHGSNRNTKQNPFVDYPGQIPRLSIIVFDMTILTEESTIIFGMDDQSLKINAVTGKARTQDYLLRLWEGYAKRDQEGLDKLTRTLRKFVLPSEFTVIPRQAVKGYLVFMGNYHQLSGAGTIVLSATTPQGDRGSFEIPVYFADEEGNVTAAVGENTGVFSNPR